MLHHPCFSSSLPAGLTDAMYPSPAQTEPKAPSIALPASTGEEDSMRGSNVLRSLSPSVADHSDACSFASATSQDLDDEPEDTTLGKDADPPRSHASKA